MDNLQTLVEQTMLILQTLIVVFLAYGAYLSIGAARDWSESPGERKADRRASPVRAGSANSAAQAKNERVNRGHPARLPGFDVASR